MQPSDSLPPVGRGSGRPWPVAYPVPRATRRKKGLPGAWAVLFQRAVGSDPAGCASRLAHRVETAIAFRLHNALGTQNERYFVAVHPTAHSLACLRIGVVVTADAARLATGVGGSPFTGRVSHPLDGKQSFMTSPHRHSPLTSLAWSHRAPTPASVDSTSRRRRGHSRASVGVHTDAAERCSGPRRPDGDRELRVACARRGGCRRGLGGRSPADRTRDTLIKSWTEASPPVSAHVRRLSLSDFSCPADDVESAHIQSFVCQLVCQPPTPLVTAVAWPSAPRPTRQLRPNPLSRVCRMRVAVTPRPGFAHARQKPNPWTTTGEKDIPTSGDCELPARLPPRPRRPGGWPVGAIQRPRVSRTGYERRFGGSGRDGQSLGGRWKLIG